MLIQTRLLFGALVACGGALIPLLSAQAQDAITSQAYAKMNQVQQQLSSGLINAAQANDLMNRYNDVIAKDQKWSMQDGGNLNVPDRLDLQGKLKGDNKRLFSDLKNNGVMGTNTGMLPGLYRSVFNSTPYGSTALNTVPYGAGTMVSNPYGVAPTPYGVAPVVNPIPYNGYGVTPVGYSGNSYYGANPYNSGIYNNGSGAFQGILNRWRGY